MDELSTNQPRKFRLLYLVTQDDLGGAQRYVLKLSQAFRNRAEVTVAAGRDGSGWLSRECAKAGLRFVSLPELKREISPLRDLQALREIKALIKNSAYDVLHANSSKAGLLTALAAYGTKTRSIYTAHGWAFLEPEGLARRLLYFCLEWLASRCRDGTIVLSEKEAQIARRWLFVPRRRIRMIPHGHKQLTGFLSREQALQELDLGAVAAPIVGTIANFYNNKGLDRLIGALGQSALSGKNFLLVIIGDGPEYARLQKMISELPPDSTKKIVLAGSVSDAWRLLKAFDLFVLPSRKEGLPFALLEALAAGLPIIATRVGGVPETLGEAGILIKNSDDTGELAQEIARLLSDQKLRQSLAERARQRSAELSGREQQMLELTWSFYITCSGSS